MGNYTGFKYQTAIHPGLTVIAAAGEYAIIRSARFGYDGTSTGTVWRGTLARYNSAGVTPTDGTAQRNTRSSAARTPSQTWATGPAIVGNPLVCFDAADRPGLGRGKTWRPARPWAGIYIVDAGEVGVDGSTVASNGTFYSIGWAEHDLGLEASEFRGRRLRSRGIYHYFNAYSVAFNGVVTIPKSQGRSNYCGLVRRRWQPSSRPGLLLDAADGTTLSPASLDRNGTRALGSPVVNPSVTPAGQAHTRAQGALKVNPQLRPAALAHTRALGTTYIAPRPAGLTHTRALGSPVVSPQLRPTGQTHTRAQGSPTVNPQLRPSGLVHTRTLGTTAVTVRISPAGIAHTRTQGSPQVNPQLRPAGQAHTRAQGTITVTVGFFLTPASLTRTRTQGNPLVNPQLRPAGQTHTRALGTTAVTTPSVRQLGGLIVTVAWIPRPTGLAHTRILGDATAHGRATLTLASQAHTRAQGIPALSGRILPASQTRTRVQGSPSVNPRTISPASVTRTRAQGTTVVTITRIARPTGQIHARAQGAPVTHGLATIGPVSLTRTRLQGTPLLSGRVLPATLIRTRQQGSPAVNVRTLAPSAISRA